MTIVTEHQTRLSSFAGFIKPLSLVPDEEDLRLHKKICGTALMSQRMRDLTPLLEYADFSYEKISAGNAIEPTPK